MKYNPDIHHRKSIRLKNYDYSKEGLYFITICTHNKEALFGEINNDIIVVGAGYSCPNIELTKIGEIIKKQYCELGKYFDNIKCNEYIIMPNHFHCIIEIVVGGKPPPLQKNNLGNIIGYFKFQTTKKYNELMNIKNGKYLKLWQRNYYENIIRNNETHQKVIEYIKTNPLKWQDDKYYL